MKRLLLSLLLPLPLLLAQCDGASDHPAEPDAARDAVADDDANVEVADAASDIADAAHEATVDAATDAALEQEATPSDNGLTLVSAQGETVSPLTVVHLGLALADGIAAPARVEWSVVQPNGSQELIHPGATPLEATFAMNVVGGYRFAALAFDADGHTTASLSLLMRAVPGPGIYVELSWHTPGDADETDVSDPLAFASAGSDVDLHVLHPKANGAWFTDDDCYWRNTAPVWGIPSAPDDDPSLDRDDTDGAGPEVITIAAPEADASYTVGVHYYDDWGFGNAFATIRIYVDGVLVDEWADVQLLADDLWQSHVIGGDGSVSRVGSVPQISPNYLGMGNPSVRITSPQGLAVEPQTWLDLNLLSTAGPVAAVVDWTVDAPADSHTAIVAGATPAEVRFQVDVVGNYVFTAAAYDGQGIRIGTATWVVMVADGIDLRVELTWTTPGDPDPSDIGTRKNQPLVGSDLDLHLLHPNAAGVLFDANFDCNFDNRQPNWGYVGSADNPWLAADDFDGTGPETISLRILEVGEAYPVAVHYWADGGFGNAFATLRVYFGDVLVDEWADVELTNDDVWRAFTIIDGSVLRVGSEPTITPDYSVSHPEIRR